MNPTRRGGERLERPIPARKDGRVSARFSREVVAAMPPRTAAILGALLFVSSGIHFACSSATDTADDKDSNAPRDNDVPTNGSPETGGSEPPACGIDGGTKKFESCPTFAADIYPNVAATGKWQCASAGCHGGAMSPTINGSTAAECLASLRAITIDGRPYLTGEGGGDPSDAAMMCNVQGACGTKMPPTHPLTLDELCLIDVWLRCGAR